MNRTSYLKRISKRAQRLDTLGSQTVAETWLMAADLFGLRGTFAAGQDKAFKAAAATACRRSESWVDNLVKAHECRESLTKAQRTSVEGWSTDMVLSLRGKDMTAAKRTSLITKVAKSGTRSPVEVRKFKRGIVGTTKRNRKGKAEETTQLAKLIGPTVAKLAKSHNLVSLIAGAQLAQDHPGKDIAAAILFFSTQSKAAAKVVAK